MMGLRVDSSRACVARGGNCALRQNDQDKFEGIAFLSVLACPCEPSGGRAKLMIGGSVHLPWKRDSRLRHVSDKPHKKFADLRRSPNLHDLLMDVFVFGGNEMK
jgi:hypothetical protein